jgi:hypothetical protein
LQRCAIAASAAFLEAQSGRRSLSAMIENFERMTLLFGNSDLATANDARMTAVVGGMQISD